MIEQSTTDFWARLKERRLVRWAIAYAAAAWLLLQVAELLFDIFEGSAAWLRALTILLSFGFLAVLVVAWFHGDKGRQRITVAEILSLALVAAGALSVFLFTDLMVIDGEGGVAEDLFAGKESRRATANPAYESGPSWSPDSDALVFMSEQSGNPELWLMQRGGSATQLTDHPAEDTQPAWSPDGRTILFVSSRERGTHLDRSVFYGYTFGGDIWSVPAFGGEPRQLVEDGYNPSWAPDGERFAFDSSRDGPRRIWIASSDGSVVRRLSEDESDLAIHLRAAWSPDGKWLVYERQPGTQASAGALVVAAADGSESFVLTGEGHRDMAPAWADADSIVFVSDHAGALNLWQVDIDFRNRRMLGEPIRVTRGAGEDFDPAVATDGTLAYSTLRRLQNLWQVDVDPASMTFGDEPQRIMSASWNDLAPALREDNGALAFTSDRDGRFDVWVLNAGDDEPRQLTDRDGQDLQPVWSPDGSRLAFFSDERGNNDIWILPIGAGPPVAITPAESNDVNPYWNSNGTEFGFTSDRSGQSEVWTMNVDGSEARKLTDIGTLGHTARWSPDDEWLLFTSVAAGHRDVWAVRSDGSEVERLTTAQTQDAHGLWSPDGRFVLYLSDHQQVFALERATGTHRMVFDLGETIDYVHLAPDGRTFVFTRERVESDIWLIE